MKRIVNYFPKYTLKESGVINIDERPPLFQCLLMGFQHVLTMFDGNVLSPLLMGMDVNTTLFFSGIGTLIYYVVTGGNVPSFVGSSFAFVGVVISATGYTYVPGSYNEHIDIAAGGILVCGICYAVTGFIVMAFGSKWVEAIMPPVVTGTVIMIIGINLSAAAFQSATETSVDSWIACITVIVILLVSAYAPDILQRISILIGMIVGYLVSLIIGWIGYGSSINYSKISESSWFVVPTFTNPKFDANAISIIVPVCVVLLAENLGHIKAISATVQKSLDNYIGRSIVGDAIATIVSSSGGGPGTTTFAQNIGVMAVTKNYSTLVFVVAAVISIILSFIEKIGAIIHTIPKGVFGGLSMIAFGLVAMSGARIWVEHQVDFKDSRIMLVAGVPLIIGAAMHNTLKWGNFQLDGIGLSTITVIILYQCLRGWDSNCRRKNKEAVVGKSVLPN